MNPIRQAPATRLRWLAALAAGALLFAGAAQADPRERGAKRGSDWAGAGYRGHGHGGPGYQGGPRGYVMVRPPMGLFITGRPALATVLVLGGLTYLYANGTYYREQPGVGYEVVPPPAAGENTAAPGQTYVYPTLAQSAEQQATDDYACHQWAVTQTGFDPTSAATGQAPGPSPARRSDYARARGACLDGRGYTLR